MDELSVPPQTSLLPGASIKLGAPWCATKRITQSLVPTPIGVVTHADCVCNERRALTLRHLVDTGARFTAPISELEAALGPVELHGLVPWSTLQVVDHYTGGKRRALQEAASTLVELPVQSKDGQVRMFLKDDKYTLDDIKEPRCIQYRNYRYGLRLGRYLKPFEREFYSIEVDGHRFSAKGMNSYGRASALREMWDDFQNPVACLFDHSKFDAHVSTELLSLEHAHYCKAFSGDELRWLLSMQLVNRGRTKNGTTYTVRGTRMSGDQNTGLGNTLLNYAILRAYLSRAQVRGHILVDGDDSVIVFERAGFAALEAAYPWFGLCGMETNRPVLVDEFQLLEFCQCRPVLVAGTWRMVRNPARVITRMPWTTRNYNAKALARLTRTIGWCELVCNTGVPVLQAYSTWFMQQGRGRMMRAHMEARALLEDTQCLHMPVLMSTRLSFEEAWGIPVQRQFTMEDKARWRLDWE